MTMNTTPRWFDRVPEDRKLHLDATHFDSNLAPILKARPMRKLLKDHNVKVVMSDGTVIEGSYVGDKNFWGSEDYIIRVIPFGLKRAKSIPMAQIKEVYGDTGPSLGEMASEYVTSGLDD